jgi:hypothetical protein
MDGWMDGWMHACMDGSNLRYCLFSLVLMINHLIDESAFMDTFCLMIIPLA